MIQYTQTHCFAIEPEGKSLCAVVFGVEYQSITPPIYWQCNNSCVSTGALLL